MRRGFKCKNEILNALTNKYNEIVGANYNRDYIEAIQDFEQIAEKMLRVILNNFYNNDKSRNQAWKTCKGALYEYAVFKCIQHIIINDKLLNQKFTVMMGDEAIVQHKDQIVIKNWSEIFPDVDILIIERATNMVKVIISCKTSLRERLTETAFWKRELERSNNTKEIRLVFITTDKDNELRTDTNRYILLHVIDSTFVTDPQKYNELVADYRNKYGNRTDFSQLISKVKAITEIGEFLHKLD